MNYSPPNWTEHYEFSNALFYAVVETIGITPPPTVQAEPDPQPEEAKIKTRAPTQRTYHSQYKGVTTHNQRFVPQWGARAVRYTGASQPMTPEGERAAATERARALGLAYLERRDGTREALP